MGGFSFHKVTKGSRDFPVWGDREVPTPGRGPEAGKPLRGVPGGPGSAGTESRAQRWPKTVSQPPLAARSRAVRSVGPGQAIPSDCLRTGPAPSNCPRRLGGPWVPQPSPRPGWSRLVLPVPSATRGQHLGPLPTSPAAPAAALRLPAWLGRQGGLQTPAPFPATLFVHKPWVPRSSMRGTVCPGVARSTPRGGRFCPGPTALTVPLSGLLSPSPFWKVPESWQTGRTLLNLPGSPTPLQASSFL